MEKGQPGNFQSDIHRKDYTLKYEHKQANVTSMLFDEGRIKESLNGYWSYEVDQYDTCLRADWYKERYFDEDGRQLPVDYSFDEWPKILLPCCWNIKEEELLLYEGSIVFTRKFLYRPVGGERVFLKIGAANYICRVFVNGKYIGMHRGGSTPCYFDLTEALALENRILITVNNTRRPEQVPTENTDWFNYGGIYRDIELIRVPRIYIKDFTIALIQDGAFNKIEATVEMSEAVNGSGKIVISELDVIKEMEIVNGIGHTVIDVMPVLWSPMSPKLYLTEVECFGDQVCDRIGFREIKVLNGEIYLNGKKLYLRGISCHEESLENGKGLSEEERISNIKLAKELGCNFMRLAHYPHSEHMAKLADELGVLLWEEIPVYWAIDFESKKTYEDAQNQLMELIHRDKNRASVIIWSVGNENADTDIRLSFMSRLADMAHQMDPNRLVSAACIVDHESNVIADRLIEYLDVIGINEYCGWYTPDFTKLPLLLENSNPSKPVIISEFGADARAMQRGTIDDKGTEDCQAYIYQQQIDILRRISYIKGMTPWILYDFRSPRRLSFLQGHYNLKGLCSADKKYKKLAFYILQKYYFEKIKENEC